MRAPWWMQEELKFWLTWSLLPTKRQTALRQRSSPTSSRQCHTPKTSLSGILPPLRQLLLLIRPQVKEVIFLHILKRTAAVL